MEMFMNRPRGIFPLGLSLLLWVISGGMTVALFSQIAGATPWKVAIAVAWAAGLEASKVVAWWMGGHYRWLSVALIGLTLFSAVGIAFDTVEDQSSESGHHAEIEDDSYNLRLGRLVAIGKQTEVLLDRLRVLPPDFVTAAAGLTAELGKLRADDQMLRASMEAATLEQIVEPEGAFEHLARLLGWDRQTLQLGVILWVAVLTELSAMMMASRYQSRATRTSGAVFPTPEDYLAAALDHPKAPVMLGRIEVARRLGIGESTARALLEKLVQSGRVRRGTKAFEARKATDSSAPLARSRGA